MTASPGPWQSAGGSPGRHSSQESRAGSRAAVPGAAKRSVRSRTAAAGPLPAPCVHSSSSTRRPGSAGKLTTSNAPPHGSTAGAAGRCDQSACTLRGKGLAEASQSAPAGVTSLAGASDA
ncbi:hypothetical protein AA958_10530 [Streptomyces sp. CNQ-509]|nr:hypothetical protein AA958_10530 [Streptomyces sp. CNQ-509]